MPTPRRPTAQVRNYYRVRLFPNCFVGFKRLYRSGYAVCGSQRPRITRVLVISTESRHKADGLFNRESANLRKHEKGDGMAAGPSCTRLDPASESKGWTTSWVQIEHVRFSAFRVFAPSRFRD